ncbi:hypothetical protein AB1Y20_023338 [Prymnesium parvum]|uniref:Uncharacterized protein n=1 Tax=Prymnesium parvum TaxID=97485 RepID=A0AB34JFW8_PRYPA
MLRGLSSRYPTIVSAMTGFGVMCVGDGTVQVVIEGEDLGSFDWVRNSSSSIFQAVASAFMGKWWRFLDSKIPTTSIPKLAVNQVVLSGTITPGYLVWSGIVEAVLRCGPVDWTHLYSQLHEELPSLLPASIGFWLPFNTFNFMVMPAHLRVAFISSVAVAWGGYLSYVSHGRRGGSIPSKVISDQIHDSMHSDKQQEPRARGTHK